MTQDDEMGERDDSYLLPLPIDLVEMVKETCAEQASRYYMYTPVGKDYKDAVLTCIECNKSHGSHLDNCVVRLAEVCLVELNKRMATWKE